MPRLGREHLSLSLSTEVGAHLGVCLLGSDRAHSFTLAALGVRVSGAAVHLQRAV